MIRESLAQSGIDTRNNNNLTINFDQFYNMMQQLHNNDDENNQAEEKIQKNIPEKIPKKISKNIPKLDLNAISKNK